MVLTEAADKCATQGRSKEPCSCIRYRQQHGIERQFRENAVSERPAVGVITAVLIAPLVLLCCLGRAAVASLLAGFVAWLSGLGVAAVAGATVVVGALAYGFLRGRNMRLQRGTKS